MTTPTRTPDDSYQYFGLVCGNPQTQPVADIGQSLCDALQDLFPSDTGLCVMQWRGVFVPLEYKYDLSLMVDDLIDLAEFLADPTATELTVAFPSNTFRVDWRVTRQAHLIVVDATWGDVLGGTESMLEARSPLRVPCADFAAEIRHLLFVILAAIDTQPQGLVRAGDYQRLAAVAEPRSHLVALVERIIRVAYATEAEHSAAILDLESSVADPRVVDYIYYWHRHFDHEPSATEIVQRALAYRPIELGGPASGQSNISN